jgi:hypothetical protein
VSVDLEQLEAKLTELQNDYAALVATKTREDAIRAAADFTALASRDEVRGFILSAAAVGEPLQRTINAYVVSGDRRPFPEWAAEQAQAVDGIELTDKQRDSRLRKLGSELDALKKQHHEARRQAAMEALEAEFAATSGEAA